LKIFELLPMIKICAGLSRLKALREEHIVMVDKAKKIWLDGKFIDWDDANVHLLTHTLHYGYGVFEGTRCYKLKDGGSAIWRLDDHLERLYNSAKVLGIEIPFGFKELRKASVDAIKVNDFDEGYLRHIVFMGDGAMGLYANNPIRVGIAVWKWGAYLGDEGLKNGIRAKISSYTRYQVNTAMTKSKACGYYINSILAKREAISLGYDEAIMLDVDGFVSEASGENIFIVRKGDVYTPPLSSSVLGGITRDTILTIARDSGRNVREEAFARDILYTADEVFFTGTAAEVTPVREVDGRKIGDGEPGPVTLDLQKSFFEIVRGQNKKYAHWLARV